MLKFIPFILIVFLILSIVSMADVKTNIDAHAEYIKSEQEKRTKIYPKIYLLNEKLMK